MNWEIINFALISLSLRGASNYRQSSKMTVTLSCKTINYCQVKKKQSSKIDFKLTLIYDRRERTIVDLLS